MAGLTGLGGEGRSTHLQFAGASVITWAKAWTAATLTLPSSLPTHWTILPTPSSLPTACRLLLSTAIAHSPSAPASHTPPSWEGGEERKGVRGKSN